MDDATNIFRVFPGQTSKPYKGFKADRYIDLKNEDMAEIKKQFPLQVQYVTPRITRSNNVRYKTKSNNYHSQLLFLYSCENFFVVW